jgi:hypothetical protein
LRSCQQASNNASNPTPRYDQFSERELVELSATISRENYRARFNRTFAIAAEGQFCPLPDCVLQP